MLLFLCWFLVSSRRKKPQINFQNTSGISINETSRNCCLHQISNQLIQQSVKITFTISMVGVQKIKALKRSQIASNWKFLARYFRHQPNFIAKDSNQIFEIFDRETTTNVVFLGLIFASMMLHNFLNCEMAEH